MGLKANIEHIDTNIVIRLITQDDPIAVKKAEKLISSKQKVFVLEDVAMMEIVYVLTSDYYRYSRQEVSESIKTLILIDNIYSNKSVISGALDMFVSHPKLSFVDCYLAIISETSNEVPLWTLDKKLAAQSPVAKLLA